jgi:hypothetical protein
MADPRDEIREELADLLERGTDIADSEQNGVLKGYTDYLEYQRRLYESGDELDEEAPETIPEVIYPDFDHDYQLWYSRALPVIEQVLGERLREFRSLYENPGGLSSYIEDRGVAVDDNYHYRRFEHADRKFRKQLAFLKAASARLDSVLASIEGTLEAELFDSQLEVAEELRKKKHLRAAGAVAGVVLEGHLKDVATSHGVKNRKKKPTLADLNDDLKDTAFDTPTWRKIQALADIRNYCVHDKERDPTSDEVSDLIRGVSQIVKTVF